MMAKGGVYRIKGDKNPLTGVKTFYNVVDWYANTPLAQRKEELVTWELYVKGDNGYRSTGIKKRGVNHFTFGPNAHKFSYKVEGYLHEAEGKEPMAIFVQPQKNEKVKAVEKDILGVSLTYYDGSKITKALNYMDRLKAVAKCQGLEGLKVVFTLWEDDEDKDGHNTKNQYITKSPEMKVDSKGYARWNFTLFNTYINLANKREDEKKKHEYYVTAEYNGKLRASRNTNVNNPEYKLPVPKPKQNSPKTSTNPSSPNNQADPKGYVTKIELYDKDLKKITTRPQFGDIIQLLIEAKNVGGLNYTLKLWEHDYAGKNDLLYNKVHTFKNDKNVVNVRQSVSIRLVDEFRKIGEIGNDAKNPDSGEYSTGNYQEIFAEVIFEKVSAESSVINVALNTEPKKQNNGKAPAIAQKEKPSSESCVCEKNSLVWGDKIGCKERLKVIEVSKNLGVDPNWLMTVIALETAETFSPSIDNGVGYVGLIQFGKDASKDLGVTQNALVKMNFIEQMKYVQKFLEKNKTKYKTLTDLYLGVLYPSASGHGAEREYIVLDGNAYRSNPLFFKEKGEWEYATKLNKKGKKIKYKKAVDPNGKTYVWEIALVAQEIYTKGLDVKEKEFLCEQSVSPISKIPKSGDCLDTWDSNTNSKISKLHPKIRCAVKNFINEVESEMGIKLRVIQGLRTYAEQNALYAQGRTKKGAVVTRAKGGQSNHNFGVAIDVAEIKNGTIDWKEQEKVLPKIAPIGKKWGFSWGGDWKSIIDKPHFEMTFGKSLSELRKEYEKNGNDHTKISL